MTADGASAEILIVDDDAGLAGTLRDFLVEQGYTAVVALSGAEALAANQENPRLAVALVDLVMPLTDGLTLMEQIHQRNPDLPVVIMTGYATVETAVEAIKRGAEDYLTRSGCHKGPTHSATELREHSLGYRSSRSRVRASPRLRPVSRCTDSRRPHKS